MAKEGTMHGEEHQKLRKGARKRIPTRRNDLEGYELALGTLGMKGSTARSTE
ncbi:unnamed protein product [Rhodiola kirilowii]